jgi:hypothetical protein
MALISAETKYLRNKRCDVRLGNKPTEQLRGFKCIVYIIDPKQQRR